MTQFGWGFILDLILKNAEREAALEAREMSGQRRLQGILDNMDSARGNTIDFEALLEGEKRSKLKTRTKKKKKATAYNKRYSAAFKKCQHKYKKKNGQWKKNGFKRCAAEARRMAKK